MTDFTCKFCGSKERKVKRVSEFGPEIELKSNGEYGPVEDFCCTAQKQNAKYMNSFDIDHRPDPEEIEKW